MNSKDIFVLLGDGFGIPGDKMLFYLFLMVVFVIELNLFITADKIKAGVLDFDKAFKVIDFLIDDEENIRSVNSLIGEFGFRNKNEINLFMDTLSSYTWRGIQLFEKTNKDYTTQHKKKTLLSYIETKNKME